MTDSHSNADLEKLQAMIDDIARRTETTAEQARALTENVRTMQEKLEKKDEDDCQA